MAQKPDDKRWCDHLPVLNVADTSPPDNKCWVECYYCGARTADCETLEDAWKKFHSGRLIFPSAVDRVMDPIINSVLGRRK